MIKFREIFDGRKGESDLVSDKWSSYIEIYDKIFDKFSDKEISIVEIGVQNGGSLEVYNQYFPNSEVIIGIDNNEGCRKLKFTTNKIKLIIGNAAEKSIIPKLNNYAPKYDIIVDDGSHTSEDIIRSFSNLFSLIKNNGIYVIEDMHTSYFQSCQNGLYAPFSANTFFKLISDIINYEFWNNNLKPSDILNDFKKKYNFQLSDYDCTSIKSISFYNSVCVIEKGADLSIGKRVFSGKKEMIVHTTNYGVNVEDIFDIDKSLIENPTPPEILKLEFDIKLQEMKNSITKLENNFSIKKDECDKMIYTNNLYKNTNIFKLLQLRFIRIMYVLSTKLFKKRNPMNFLLRLLVKFNIISQETVDVFIKYE
jgi:hypothetical protein